MPPNPAEPIESEAMSKALARLVERYELVVLDTAPVGAVSDVFPLLHKVDGVIAVARMGRSTRDSVRRLREQLDRLEAPVLGIVANAIKLRKRRKYGLRVWVLRRLWPLRTGGRAAGRGRGRRGDEQRRAGVAARGLLGAGETT